MAGPRMSRSGRWSQRPTTTTMATRAGVRRATRWQPAPTRSGGGQWREQVEAQLADLADGLQQTRSAMATMTLTPGPPGHDGRDGTDGKDGVDGLNGRAGADSTVPGPRGPIGADGPRGLPGTDGARGLHGADSTVPGPEGPRGATGPAGPSLRNRQCAAVAALPALAVNTPVDVTATWDTPLTAAPADVRVVAVDGLTTRLATTVKSVTATKVVVTVTSPVLLAAAAGQLRLLALWTEAVP